MRMGMRTSSFPLSFLTSAAMPASSAPVSATMPRKPPSTNTNRHTGNASAKPRTGAVATSAMVAPLIPWTPISAIATVTMARTIKMMSKMLNDERVLLAFSPTIATPPFPIDFEFAGFLWRKAGSSQRKNQEVMSVPVSPFRPAAAHSSEVIRARPAGCTRRYSRQASIFGSMLPAANCPSSM